MGFFYQENTKSPKKQTLSKLPPSLAKLYGCQICSLKGNKKLAPYGSENPDVYIIVKAPVDKDTLIGGDSGEYLMSKLISVFGRTYVEKNFRFGACLSCYSDKASAAELECCKTRLLEDIAKTKPRLIVGLGEEPLNTIVDTKIISNWRGRLVPVSIKDYNGFYIPTFSHEFIISKRNPKYDYDTEYDAVFLQDLKYIRETLKISNLTFVPEKSSDYTKGITIVTEVGMLEDLDTFIRELKNEPVVSIDIETTGLRPYAPGAKMLSIAIGTDTNTWAYPLDYPQAFDKEIVDYLHMMTKNFLLEHTGIKVAHNLKFELEWFNYFYGRETVLNTEWADTMAQAYLIDERTSKEMGMHSLNTLTRLHFGFWIKKLTNVDRANCLGSSLSDLLLYNGMDTKYEHKLFLHQLPMLEEVQEEAYYNLIETEKTLALVQAKGLPLCEENVKNFSKSFTKQIAEIHTKIQELPEVLKYKQLYNSSFNPESSSQLTIIFDTIMKIAAIKQTSTGKYSTDVEVLDILAERGIPLAQYVKELREISKLKSTYIDSVAKEGYADKKFHTNFNPMFTATGRLSSDSPNLQNFPKRKHKDIRNIVACGEGEYIVAVDYGQIEARVIAEASKDQVFMDAVKTGYDIHKEWAIKVLKLYPKAVGKESFEDITPDEIKKYRSIIKNQLVFPWFYRAGRKSVGNNLGLPEEITQQLFNDFWDTFKGVKKWQQSVQSFYDRHGYVTTLTGKRRHAPLSASEMVNSPIQGTASDIVVNAMNLLRKEAITTGKEYLLPILNIHDDISFIIQEEYLETGIEEIAKIMCCVPKDFLDLEVPIAVEVSVGKEWGDLEDIAIFSSEQFQ